MKTEYENLKAHDLGLAYGEALHGVQSSIAFGFFERSCEPKHMRTGIDMSKADMLGLVSLLIDKKIFTSEEYIEYIRLTANFEVSQREKQAKDLSGKEVSFR